MRIRKPEGGRVGHIALLLIACATLVACGDSGLPPGPGSGNAPGGANPPPTATAHLTISVTDLEGKPLPDAQVIVSALVTPPSIYLGHRITHGVHHLSMRVPRG